MNGVFNRLKRVVSGGKASSKSHTPDSTVNRVSGLKTDPDYKLFKKVLKDQNLFFDEGHARKLFLASRAVRDNAPFYGDPLTGGNPPMSVTNTLIEHQEAIASLGGIEHFINLIVVPAAAIGVHTRAGGDVLARLWKENSLEWSSNLFKWSFMPHDKKSIEEIAATEKAKKILDAAAKPNEAIVAKRVMLDVASSPLAKLPYKVVRTANEFSRVIKEFKSFQKYLDKNISEKKARQRLSDQSDLVDKSLGLDQYKKLGPDLTVLKNLEIKVKKPTSSASLMAALTQAKHVDKEYKKMKVLLKNQNLNFSEAEQKKIYEAYRAVRDRAPSYGCGTEEENGKTPMSITEELIEHKDAFIKLGGFEYFTLLIIVPASKMGICVRSDLPVIAEKWKEHALEWSQNLLNRSFSEHDGKSLEENKKTREVKKEILEKSHPYAVEIYNSAQAGKK